MDTWGSMSPPEAAASVTRVPVVRQAAAERGRDARDPEIAATLTGRVENLYRILYSIVMGPSPDSKGYRMTPLTEARSRLSEIVDDVTATGSTFVISRHGRPAAVVIGYEEYESLVETMNILADDATMAALAEAERDIAAGELTELD